MTVEWGRGYCGAAAGRLAPWLEGGGQLVEGGGQLVGGGGNPSQEGYNNSINPLVEGVAHIFTGLHLGGPTYSQALHIQGPPA